MTGKKGFMTKAELGKEAVGVGILLCELRSIRDTCEEFRDPDGSIFMAFEMAEDRLDTLLSTLSVASKPKKSSNAARPNSK